MNTVINYSVKGEMEKYFSKFSRNIIGSEHSFENIHGKKRLLYADWVASGRLYMPIEEIMLHKIAPMIANTHSFSSETGKASTYGYRYAREIIKKHVNAHASDVLVTTGTGMTAALSKLHRIMGLRSLDNCSGDFPLQRPVVFITHMEHHSNQVPWYETIAEVVILPADEHNLVNPQILNEELKKYQDRNLKIGCFTACSNVTGIITPYGDLAKIMHQHGGLCFIDFAASAPYVKIDMHPEDSLEQLDAIFFSPHKFLGGPGTCGVLVFNEKLYKSDFPDNPGGGNVKCTDPWGGFHYTDAIEVKEDGGTPGFLQVMRTALSLKLKDQMGVENMQIRERELLQLCYLQLSKIEGLSILGDIASERIGCVSFTITNIHYNLIVRLLNDRFGIQIRGGWSCASTYAHYLLGIDQIQSSVITKGILQNDLTNKPGWVRLSLHPVMSDEELLFICEAIQKIAVSYKDWQNEYRYNPLTNEFDSLIESDTLAENVKEWFSLK